MMKGVRMVYCQGGSDKHAHGWASGVAALPFCKQRVKRAPEHNRAELCAKCLPFIAKRMRTTVANVRAIAALPANKVVPLGGEIDRES